MRSFLVFLCVAFFAKNAFGANDVCVDYPNMENFDADKILGFWYIHKHYESEPLFESKCAHLNITSSETGKFNIHFSAITNDNKSYENLIYMPVNASGVSNYNIENYALVAKFLDADYDNYFIRYICHETTPKAKSAILIATRSHTMSSDAKSKLIRYLSNHYMRTFTFKDMDHTSCGH